MTGRGRGKRSKVLETDNKCKEEKVTKTSRKKQFPIVAVVGPDGIEGNLLPDIKRPLIVHLPIQSKDVPVLDMPLMYDPMPPTDAQPYDINADNPFYEGEEQIEMNDKSTINNTLNEKPEMQEKHEKQDKKNITDGTSQQSEIDYYSLKSTLLVQYKDSSEVKNIPQTSDSACFWCCHVFSTRPVVLPIRDTGEYLQVTGNFCCPECACAYLFDMKQDSHTRWEQMALLYRVYGEACQGKIHPAPSKNVLKLFGGNLSINEYRNLINSHKVRIDIHLPPMVSILATMDTKPIDFYDASLTKGVTETVKERLQKAEEVLRLRRTKPLKAWESTLDSFINLKSRV
jgi:hypothetical protein